MQEVLVASEYKPSKDSCTMSMIAHLLCIFTGFVGPLVIYLVKRNEDKFVSFHSLQAVYFELLGIVFSFVTCGVGSIVIIIFNIIALIHANDGEWYEYPIAGKWAR